jgi:hypothetical protein
MLVRLQTGFRHGDTGPWGDDGKRRTMACALHRSI